jgi:hypothetical protein
MGFKSVRRVGKNQRGGAPTHRADGSLLPDWQKPQHERGRTFAQRVEIADAGPQGTWGIARTKKDRFHYAMDDFAKAQIKRTGVDPRRRTGAHVWEAALGAHGLEGVESRRQDTKEQILTEINAEKDKESKRLAHRHTLGKRILHKKSPSWAHEPVFTPARRQLVELSVDNNDPDARKKRLMDTLRFAAKPSPGPGGRDHRSRRFHRADGRVATRPKSSDFQTRGQRWEASKARRDLIDRKSKSDANRARRRRPHHFSADKWDEYLASEKKKGGVGGGKRTCKQSIRNGGKRSRRRSRRSRR